MYHATLNQLFSASNLNAGWGASVFVFSAAGEFSFIPVHVLHGLGTDT
jgi:hypothetical protein